MHSASIMDYVQALFSFFIAPLFGTVILGMLWKRATTAGGFWGLLAGTVTSVGLWAWVHNDPRRCATSPSRRTPKPWPKISTARCGPGWSASLSPWLSVCMTAPRPVAELEGLVYGVIAASEEHDDHWYQKPIVWASVIAVLFVILNIIFW